MGTVYVFNTTPEPIVLSIATDQTDPTATDTIYATDETATPPYSPNSLGVGRSGSPPLSDGTWFINGMTNHVRVDMGKDTSPPVDLLIPSEPPLADLWLYVTYGLLLLFDTSGKQIGSGRFAGSVP